MQTILCVSLLGLHAESAFIESKNWLNICAMAVLLVPATGILVIKAAAGGPDEIVDARMSEFVLFLLRSDSLEVVTGTVAVVDDSSGGFVLAEATSPAGSFAASGPLPTAGTMPTCFEGVAPEPFPPLAKDDDELLAEGKGAVEKAGEEADDRGGGGIVLADKTSAAGSVAAPGPLPTAGTSPTCLEGFAVDS